MFVTVGGGGLSACGGAAAGSAAPTPPAEPAPQPLDEPATSETAPVDAHVDSAPAEATVDEAALAFERAEDQLDALLTASLDDDLGEDRNGKEAEPRGPRPAQPPVVRPPRTGDLEQSRQQQASACSRACQALGSMRRSSERLCSLTGEDDPRCDNVRQRLGRARDAVRRRCRECQG